MAALADEGLDVVVDDVWLDGEPSDYTALPARFRVWHIGLFAPLDVPKEREVARGDRMVGLARDQWQRKHTDVRHYLEIDMFLVSSATATKHIAALAGL